MKEKVRKRTVTAIASAMYAAFASFGYQTDRLEQIRPLHAMLVAAGLFVPIYALLSAMLRRSERAIRDDADRTEQGFSWKRCFILLFVCYVPMFLIMFPGSFAYDVPFQLKQVFTGDYLTSHPLAHTLLLGGCVALGKALGSINAGAALYSLVQMTAMAALFAAACASIARQSSVRAAKWGMAFFALYPLHMMYAVNATKDVLFGGFFVLTTALVREALVMKREGRGHFAAIVFSLAGMMMLRGNGILAVTFWLVPTAFLLGKRGMKVFISVALAIALYVGASSMLKVLTDAQGGNPRELLSWPIQQMARARLYHGDRLTQEEKAAIDELMPENVWQQYDPTISDPVKYHFETERFFADPARYVDVYLSVGRKCPGAYADALLKMTYSFWYPYSEYRVAGYYLQMGVTQEYYEWCDFERITSSSLIPRVRASLEWRFGAQGAMQIPVIGWLFNMGVLVWIMLYFVVREAYLGNRRSLAALLLPTALWATYLLGPVMAGRYLYPCICCLPVMASRERTLEVNESM